MFNLKKPLTDLDIIIDKLQTLVKETNPTDKDYPVILEQLNKLYAMKKNNASPRVSPDALLGAAATILGIVIIIGYEKFGNVITTKAFTRLPR